MVWLKKEEVETAELICKLAGRVGDISKREYDPEESLGAAPIYMACDRKVFLHDLEFMKHAIENLISSVNREE